MVDEPLKAAMRRMGPAHLKAERFVPATGIGLFDASFDPNTKKMLVLVKVFYEFAQDPNKADELPWPVEKSVQFKRDTKANIESFWSNRYRIECVKEGWSGLYADVEIELKEVPRSQAYFNIKVTNIANYKSSGGIEWSATPAECRVNNHANVADTTKATDRIFNYKEGLLRNQLRGLDPKGYGDFIPFAKNSHEPPSDLSFSLGRWTTYCKNQLKDPDLAPVKAYCVGLRGKTDGMGHHHIRSRRAQAICDWINTRVPRVGNPFAEVIDESSPIGKEWLQTLASRPSPHNTKTGNGGVLIAVTTPPNTERSVPFRYIVMNHEFGHMLGLPDEYRGVLHAETETKAELDAVFPATYQSSVEGADERVVNMQKGMTEAVTRGGVPQPNFMGTSGTAAHEEAANFDASLQKHYSDRDAYRDKVGRGAKYDRWNAKNPVPQQGFALPTVSSSIMHSGSDVLPAHYVTIWSALCKATNSCLEAHDWKISPHPASKDTRKFFATS